MTKGVHPLRPHEQNPTSGEGGENGNGNLHGRVSALEARLDYLATREDIQKLKTWVLGGVLGAAGIALTIVLAVFQWWFG